MKNLKIGLISLGCDKNRVDSEILLAKVKAKHEIVNDPKKADVIIVNTCGFIEASKQESIDTILEMAKYKTEYNCKVLAATGCLSQRYGKELLELLPEVDIFLGTNDYSKFNEYIDQYLEKQSRICMCNYSDSVINEGERVLTTQQHVAYLRIAEGCDNFCTYCIIPKIRGKFRSRTMENIVKEAEALAANGAKELILIAQDTTMYGKDLYGASKTHELIRALSQISGIEWIRLLYCYPEELTDELMDEIAQNPKVCKYLDIPMQHVSNSVLKRMGRRSSKEQITGQINKLREKIDGIVLRTSLIVGFPGETDEEFNELKKFVEDMKLDNLGVFEYSPEEGTPAARMTDMMIDESVKRSRRNAIMKLQQKITTQINESKSGKLYDVLIEKFDGENYIGRSYEMAPEIDGVIYVTSKDELNVGSFVSVKITDNTEYDLIGVVNDESCQ